MILPLFPLNAVLFPGGALALKVFEPRYTDMMAQCLRESSPFGVCLIKHGNETGAPAEPFDIGTKAHVTDWNMPSQGVLQVRVQGSDRFRICSRTVEKSGLQVAEVEILSGGGAVPISERHLHLVPLLRAIIADLGPAGPTPPYLFEEARWVGFRYSEVLPIPNSARQKLLELDDDDSRLEIVFRYLQEKNLIAG